MLFPAAKRAGRDHYRHPVQHDPAHFFGSNQSLVTRHKSESASIVGAWVEAGNGDIDVSRGRRTLPTGYCLGRYSARMFVRQGSSIHTIILFASGTVRYAFNACQPSRPGNHEPFRRKPK